MGRYCLHFHLSGYCADNCVFANNSVHDTFQRGIVVHGTHQSLVKGNTIYNARGANIYMEDGNEYDNMVVEKRGGVCRVPLVQNLSEHVGRHEWAAAGLPRTRRYMGNLPSNHYLYNRMVLHENGFFIDSKGLFANGQGIAMNRICAGNQPLLTVKGNVHHSNTGFGFYLNENWPKQLDITQNGLLPGTTPTRAAVGSLRRAKTMARLVCEDGFDWLNNFVGAYDQGDIGYKRQVSYHNNHGIYWKTTKNFANMPRQPHIQDSLFLENNLWLGSGGTRNLCHSQHHAQAENHRGQSSL